MIAALYALAILIGYLLGSIPFGLLIGRAFAGADIRQVGSGKTGMTNVMRAAGKKAAAVSLILDMGKSALAVLSAAIIFTTPLAESFKVTSSMETAMVLAGLAAITGHTWSVFLKFKGGRGVATFIGGLMVMYWQAAVIGGVLILIIAIRTKYMSMGSIIGAVAAFIVLMSFSILRITFFGPYPSFIFVLYAMIGAIFIYVVHRDNVMRLFNGTERRLDEKTHTGGMPPSGFPD
jgi:acyl phosphate:glycerol-3-phosphate acyltransferase